MSYRGCYIKLNDLTFIFTAWWISPIVDPVKERILCSRESEELLQDRDGNEKIGRDSIQKNVRYITDFTVSCKL